MEEKRKKTYNFHNDGEEELFFTTVKDKSVCLICGVTVAIRQTHVVNLKTQGQPQRLAWHAT